MTDAKISALHLLTRADASSKAPGKIEFAAYEGMKMKPACGDDHLIWTLAIGKNHTATVIMHKDDYAALQGMADT